MNVAVIDLGSNTFHLLIVAIDENFQFKEIYRNRIFTALCEGGIDKINESSIKNGLETCSVFKQKMDEYAVSDSIITGTAALRFASNATTFINNAEKIFNQKIDIIDGDEEAELIFKGIHLLHDMNEPTLIIDIGGGSTEFIVVENGKIKWKNSYKIGVGVLYSQFHKSEPISEDDERQLRNFIKIEIQELIHFIKLNGIDTLIGASGSFEVLESMSGLSIQHESPNEIQIMRTGEIINKIVKSDFNQRAAMDGLPMERVKYIVVAMILIDEILKISNPKKLIVSPYALKEGLIVKLIERINRLGIN